MNNQQARHNPTLTGLREALFATLQELRSKTDPMDIARAKAVCEVAREITDTARVEIDYQRVTGNEIDSGFLSPLPAPESTESSDARQAPTPQPIAALGGRATGHGIAITCRDQNTGGTVTRHQIR